MPRPTLTAGDATRSPADRRPLDWPTLAAIAAGGALGAPARHGLGLVLGGGQPTGAPDGFPWATFWVNITGSVLLGFVLVAVLERFPTTRYLRPLVATGFVGSYTTYSAFALEGVHLLEDGRSALAVGYMAGTVVVGLAAAWAGVLLGRVALRRGRHGQAVECP